MPMNVMPFLSEPLTTMRVEDNKRAKKLRVSDGFGFGVSA